MSTPSSSQETLSIPEALSRAHAHWDAGQADQAEQFCQRALAVWPGQADALHLLGLMAHAYGNLDLSISHLRQACMAPRAPAVYSSNLAEMFRQKGLLAEGEEAARRAVAMDPALVSGWNNLGILLQEAGNFAESLECLERLIALQPDWAEAHNNLANTSRRLGRLGRTEQHYRQALGLKLADLLISVDSSPVRLAGALGRPVWVMQPFVPDWRWLLERTDTPWYPGMRLFRQPARGDWGNVMAAMATELDCFAA